MIQDLLSFISRYEPGFPKKIRGVSQEEIEKLEQLAGRKLPTAYREFLAAMGNDAGNCHSPEEDLRFQLVLGFYERHRTSWPHDYVFIGRLKVEPAVDYHLELSGPGAPDGRVVGVDRGERPTRDKIWPYFPSLQDMLFSEGFYNLRVVRLPYRKTFTPRFVRQKGREGPEPATTLNAVSELASKMGFQKLPYTSSKNPMFERGDAVLIGTQHPHGDGFSFEVATEEAKELSRMVQVICDNLPVSVSQG